jgi:hypothetical protein
VDQRGAVGGLYHLATEQAEPVSLRRFGDSLAAWAGLSVGAFGFGGWEQALRAEPGAAFAHNALVGGTPGYRELVPDPQVPEDPAQLGGWLTRNVLRPSMPLFDEARRVVHEDPRIRDTAAYSSVLAAVAAGESSPTKIGGLLGRPATSLTHQLTTLASAGFIDRRHDLLLDRRPVVTIADPMVRFHQLVIEPYLADLEAGRPRQVWAEAEHTVESKIFGPHFEALAGEWVARYASEEAGLAVGPVGQTVIACREHKTGHEIDVLALARGSRPRTPDTPVAFIGEAKHRDRRPGLAELVGGHNEQVGQPEHDGGQADGDVPALHPEQDRPGPGVQRGVVERHGRAGDVGDKPEDEQHREHEPARRGARGPFGLQQRPKVVDLGDVIRREPQHRRAAIGLRLDQAAR